jgi:hypothetical protein
MAFRVLRFIAVVVRWLYGHDLQIDDTEEKNHIGSFITLFALFFTGPAGALFTERRPGFRWVSWLMYIALSSGVLLAVVAMNRASKKRNGETYYAFDGATKMIGRAIFTILLCLLCVFAYAGLTRQWIEVSTRVSRVEVLHDKALSDVAELELFAPLLKGYFSDGTPETIKFRVTLDEATATDWRLDQAQLYAVDTSGNADPESKRGADISPGSSQNHFTVVFSGLPEMTRGRVRLILVARDDRFEDLRNAAKEQNREKKKEMLKKLQVTWDAMAKETKIRLDAQGGVDIAPQL